MDSPQIINEYQESNTTTFEWTLRGLQSLFESSKGESKSKVTKSVKFGGGRWQVLFYPNAGGTGSESGTFISIYLSCEPTAEEKECAVDGKWVREGVYQFSFGLRNIGKPLVFNNKEAHNHSFSHKTANWGWAQFARRDAVYYSSTIVKSQDALTIVCTITSSPSDPVLAPITPVKTVPRGLLETVGSLLDDPLYSDVEFILPNHGRRRVWASQKLLERAEYFETMFNSGFSEASTDRSSLNIAQSGSPEYSSALPSLTSHFEDSDDEMYEDDTHMSSSDSIEQLQEISSSDNAMLTGMNVSDEPHFEDSAEETNTVMEDVDQEDQTQAHASTSTPRTVAGPLDYIPGPPKISIIINDVAYTTFFAVLYFIYTDSIVFAPLSSSFTSPSSGSETPPPSSPLLSQNLHNSTRKTSSSFDATPTSRREWIAAWMKRHPGRPAPCSAKAAYRLADRIGLRDLRERAYQHIVKSLTVENIPYEVFSPFSAAYETVRKVEVQFFLDHWPEIRTSEAMQKVWKQIRHGRHPGFETVWPVIAQCLVFQPSADDADVDG